MRFPTMHEDCDEKCLNLVHHGHECHSQCEALLPETGAYIRDARRKALEKSVTETALTLFGNTLSDSFLLPIDRTNPQLFVVAGTADSIRELLKDKS